MATGAYLGVGGVKKLKECYVGVGGGVRSVKEIYVGVGGVPKLVWSKGIGGNFEFLAYDSDIGEYCLYQTRDFDTFSKTIELSNGSDIFYKDGYLFILERVLESDKNINGVYFDITYYIRRKKIGATSWEGSLYIENESNLYGSIGTLTLNPDENEFYYSSMLEYGIALEEGQGTGIPTRWYTSDGFELTRHDNYDTYETYKNVNRGYSYEGGSKAGSTITMEFVIENLDSYYYSATNPMMFSNNLGETWANSYYSSSGTTYHIQALPGFLRLFKGTLVFPSSKVQMMYTSPNSNNSGSFGYYAKDCSFPSNYQWSETLFLQTINGYLYWVGIYYDNYYEQKIYSARSSDGKTFTGLCEYAIDTSIIDADAGEYLGYNGREYFFSFQTLLLSDESQIVIVSTSDFTSFETVSNTTISKYVINCVCQD